MTNDDSLRRHKRGKTEAEAASNSGIRTGAGIGTAGRAAINTASAGNRRHGAPDRPVPKPMPGTDPGALAEMAQQAADVASSDTLDIPDLGCVRVVDVLFEYDTPVLQAV